MGISKVKKINLILLLTLIISSLMVVGLFRYLGTKHTQPKSYPFFASTRYIKTNTRSGPGLEYPVLWTYNHHHTPVEIMSYYKGWYKVKDFSGKLGWIIKRSVSTTKSAFTLKKISVYVKPNVDARKVATIAQGIIVIIYNKERKYSEIMLKINNLQVKGWTKSQNLWGSF